MLLLLFLFLLTTALFHSNVPVRCDSDPACTLKLKQLIRVQLSLSASFTPSLLLLCQNDLNEAREGFRGAQGQSAHCGFREIKKVRCWSRTETETFTTLNVFSESSKRSSGFKKIYFILRLLSKLCHLLLMQTKTVTVNDKSVYIYFLNDVCMCFRSFPAAKMCFSSTLLLKLYEKSLLCPSNGRATGVTWHHQWWMTGQHNLTPPINKQRVLHQTITHIFQRHNLLYFDKYTVKLVTSECNRWWWDFILIASLIIIILLLFILCLNAGNVLLP